MADESIKWTKSCIEHKPIFDIQVTDIHFTIEFIYPSEVDFTQDAFLHYVFAVFN